MDEYVNPKDLEMVGEANTSAVRHLRWFGRGG